jgi:ATP-dependent DNA ligase
MELPVLYQKSSNNKIKSWTIEVVSYEIIINHGYIDGKKQEIRKKLKNGKNVGKKNETTKEEQAHLEAKSRWDKKKQEGYCESKEENTQNEEKIIYPMLALDFNKRSHDIKYPCYTQPKIDGCRAVYKNGMFMSRNWKRFHNLDHINITTDYIFDGELYSEDIPFEELVGIIKKEKVKDEDKSKIDSLIYVIYDIIIEDKTYQERMDIIENLDIFNKNVKKIKTDICHDTNEIRSLHDIYVSNGYEGLMLRNIEGHYKQKYRSKDLQKFKDFKDSEYIIDNFSQGQGLEEGCVIWECKTERGLKFKVRTKGTRESRRDQYKKAKDYIGKLLTVKYQNLTEEGIPRFPVGLAIRDYE